VSLPRFLSFTLGGVGGFGEYGRGQPDEEGREGEVCGGGEGGLAEREGQGPPKRRLWSKRAGRGGQGGTDIWDLENGSWLEWSGVGLISASGNAEESPFPGVEERWEISVTEEEVGCTR